MIKDGIVLEVHEEILGRGGEGGHSGKQEVPLRMLELE